jgi:Ala-tRNA(Pro) deacylase
MITQRLKTLLETRQAAYEVLPHREVFTAQEVAATTDVSGHQLAKVVIARDDADQVVMAVLPAACRLDLAALGRRAGGRRLTLATEQQFRSLFPDCDPGAMPPFGDLYAVPMYVDSCFPQTRDFFFQAGNHHEVVRMSWREYSDIERPQLGEFCAHA